MAHPRVVDALWNHLRRSDRGEGCRESIYVDLVGLPTVGAGMMLRQSSQVRAFTWYDARTRAGVAHEAVIAAWRPFQPVGDQQPSQAGREALARRGSGATVVPQYVTNVSSIEMVFRTVAKTCEERAIEAMGRNVWNASPADAQFGILMHLWRAPNELRGGWPNFRGALQRRDWQQAAEHCPWVGMRRCRREDLQLAFRNAAFVEQAHIESGADILTLHFPSQYTVMTRGRWRGAP